jgi:ABC-2 type transport system permease protein
MNPRIALAIARKDVVDAFRNLYLLSAVLFPVGLSLLFSLAFSPENGFRLGTVAVYDQGRSMLVERLREHPLITQVAEVDSRDALAEVVRGDALGGLALPAGFDEAVAAGQSPEMELLVDGSRGVGELAALRQLLVQQLKELAGLPEPARVLESDVTSDPLVAVGDAGIRGLFLVVLLMLALAMTGVFVVPTLLVEEKERHTLKTILVSPASYTDVVIGKALAGLVYALLGAAILLALNDGLRGNVVAMISAVLLGAIFLVQVGLLLGALFSTTAQVNTWSSVVMLLLILPTWLGGNLATEWLNTLVRVLPTYYLADLISLARIGAPLQAMWTSFGVLAGCAVAAFVAVVWALRRSAR